MKIFLDTNILLDVLVGREPHYPPSSRIWTLVREEMIEGYLSAISVNNLYYIIRKLKDRQTAEAFVDQVLEDFSIIGLNSRILRQARTVPKKDYEDLIQYFSAIGEGCEFLVTRNKKDFPAIGIQLVTPQEVLNIINEN